MDLIGLVRKKLSIPAQLFCVGTVYSGILYSMTPGFSATQS